MSAEKVHLRHVLLYEFRKGVAVGTAVKNIRDVYQDCAPAIRTVKKWFAKFRRSDFNLDDAPRSGRSSGIDDNIVHNLVQTNSRISTEEIAQRLKVDRSTAFRHLKKIGYTQKLDVWVPHLLTEANKLNRVSAAVSLLGRLNNEPFLDRLMTGDEKWVLYDNVQRKRTWKVANERAELIAKPNLHPAKVMLSVWWDCQGILYFELLPAGQTIDSEKYCQQLENLKTAIQARRPSLVNRKGVVFHQDNAKPHTAKRTLAKLKELKWDGILHPPYSPDIAPSDYYLF
ncbi:PREDICTED: histone-lysine N-methyltransferase SETMAR-like [Dufourea novaeangliae]|uniref:histone-lysine N-methyltransferase SETMAR-like n=1 Tax=Dufourea novaeangliae TaxID=178035 RepID=UPI000767BA30|nr:PREDICTED: histone-lysine N-methyltransferase SETMAR-like [Dufourea novaeangliae]